MKAMLRTVPLLAAMCLSAAPLIAAEGILIVEKTTTDGTVKTNQTQIEKTRMRAETAGANGVTTVVVFDATAQVIRFLDYDKKTYNEMTKADVDRIGGQMSAAMAQMQEQMKNLPPEQRAQMEAMMRGGGMAAAMPKTEYRKAGTDKVGKWTCDKYDGYQNNQKTSEICTVDPKALGFSAADFEVTQQLGEFFQKLMPQNADQMFTIGKGDAQGFSGIPVRRMFTVLQRQITSEMTDTSRQTFPDSTFAVPAGFQKQASPLGGRGPGRQ